MLNSALTATVAEDRTNTCNCMDQHHPSTTEENKIFMQIGFRCQHITVNTEVNTDHEEKVRKILNGKGSLGQ